MGSSGPRKGGAIDGVTVGVATGVVEISEKNYIQNPELLKFKFQNLQYTFKILIFQA